MSKSLFVEQIACLLIESLICSFAHKTGAIRSKNVEENNFFCTFFVSFFLNQWFAHFLFFNERCEWITRFLNESLFRSLFANFFAKTEWFAQKTDEVIPYPAWAKLKKQHFSRFEVNIFALKRKIIEISLRSEYHAHFQSFLAWLNLFSPTYASFRLFFVTASVQKKSRFAFYIFASRNFTGHTNTVIRLVGGVMHLVILLCLQAVRWFI